MLRAIHLIVLTCVDIFLVRSSCVTESLAEPRISHSLSGSRFVRFRFLRPQIRLAGSHLEGSKVGSQGALACVSLLVSVVEWRSGGSRQERQERVSCWQEEPAARGTDPPVPCLTTTNESLQGRRQQHQLTGVSLPACLRLLARRYLGPYPGGGWVARDLRDARWQGMGGWVPACWVRRVGLSRSCHFHQTHVQGGVGGMTQTVRHGSSLDYVV